jgi:hypothetical protein
MPDILTYSNIIDSAIADFDSIFSILAAKKVAKTDAGGSHVLGTTGYTVSDGIRTSEYASLISSNLIKVSGVNDLSNQIAAGINADGTLRNYKGASTGYNDLTATITKGSTTAELSLTGISAGYYEGNTLSTTIDLRNITLTGVAGVSNNFSLSEVELSSNQYIITPPSGKLLGTVIVDKGTVELAKPTLDLTGLSLYGNLSASVGSVNAELVTSEPSSGVYIPVTIAHGIYGSISATSIASVVRPGYVSSLSSSSNGTTEQADFGTSSPSETVTETKYLKINPGSATVTVDHGALST